VKLDNARVLVLGCGSVGGLAAWGLASAGVGTLILVDREQLEPGNLRRHVCGSGEIGNPKAHAVARFLHDRFPALALEPHQLDALELPDDLRSLIESVDSVLVAVDAEGPKHLVDAMTRELNKPTVYVGVYGGGWAGEVILSDGAARTPCYACSARSLGRVGIPFEGPVGPDYVLPSPEVPESQWPRADLTSLMPVASLAVRLLVAVLADRRGWKVPLAEFAPELTSAWRLALRDVPDWGGPWELVLVPSPRQAECWLCGKAIASDADKSFENLSPLPRTPVD
jgi:hypothetical protein